MTEEYDIKMLVEQMNSMKQSIADLQEKVYKIPKKKEIDPEKLKKKQEYAKEYYQKNKEILNANHKKYYQKTKEERKKYNKEYYQKIKEKSENN